MSKNGRIQWCQGVDIKKENNRLRFQRSLKNAQDGILSIPVIIGNKTIRKGLPSFMRENPSDIRKGISLSSFADEATVHEAITVAEQGAKKWAGVSPDDRLNILRKTRLLFVEEKDTGWEPKDSFFDLGSTLVLNNGFSQYEAIAGCQEIIDHISFAIAWGEEMLGIHSAFYHMAGESNEEGRAPIGIVAEIAPFNFPAEIPAADIAAALVNGNSVIVKPSEKAVLPTYRLCEAFWKAGIPKEALLFVPGEGSVVGRCLADDPRIALVCFTGSQRVGLDIAERIAQSAKRHNKPRYAPYLELGGKNTMYIDRNVNIRRIMPFFIQAAFSRQGQKCSAASLILVHEDIREECYAIMDEAVKTFFQMRDPKSGKLLMIGDPAESDSVFLGPVIDKVQKEKIETYIRRGKEDFPMFTEINLENEKNLQNGYFVNPTIFYDVPVEHAIASEEIFGPVIGVIPVKDEKAAVEITNSREYDLTTSDFSNLLSVRNTLRRKRNIGTSYSGTGNTGNIPGQGFTGGMRSTPAYGPKRGFYDFPERFCRRTFYHINKRFYGEIIDAKDLES